MLAQIVNQTESAARLLEKAQKAVAKVRGLRTGDRVFTPLVATAEFAQGSAPSVNLIFNVPADADFWAYRLLFYPYCKVVDPVNLSPDEVAFRSTSFSGESNSSGVVSPAIRYSDFNTLFDANFALIYQGKELQNMDTPISAAYCTNTGKWCAKSTDSAAPINVWAGASQTPAGLVFDIPLFLPRAKSLTCRVTPTHLGLRTKTDVLDGPVTVTRQHRYKIVGVLEGEKKVTAFR